MVRPKEIKGSPKQVNLNLETTLYEEFERLLPRHKSVSEAIREYMKATVDESKKVEALARLPILNSSHARQTTMTEYDIYIFQDSRERFQILQNLSTEQKTKLAIDVKHLNNQIAAVRK
jgi:metal-responsive CopG/Arc/MetJ family transcriptional regulator